MIQIQDTLVLPNNSPLAKATLTVTTVLSTETLTGTYFKAISSETGDISFNLLNGIFDITLKTYKGHIVMESTVEVTPNVPTPITLVDLITNHTYVPAEQGAA